MSYGIDYIEYVDSYILYPWSSKLLEFLTFKSAQSVYIDGNGWYSTDGSNVVMLFAMQLFQNPVYL